MFEKSLKFKALWSVMLTLALLIAPFAVQAQGSSSQAKLITPQGAQVVPDHYIVVFKANSPAVNAEAVNASVAALGGQVKFVYGAALNGYSAYLPTAALAAVRSDPAVAYVEADAIISLEPEPEGVNAEVIQNNATWGLDRVDQRNLPLSTTYTYNRTGVGVHAYIIDTGIRQSHVQFGGRATRDFDALGGNGNDCNGHGTHVAGTVGGSTYGVAKRVRIHAIRVLDCGGSGTWAGVIAGVNWVAAHRSLPAVANLSLGGPPHASLDAAIKGLIAQKVTVVVAAANDNANACNYSPARVPAAITVGATTSNDTRADFSNFGGCLDIFAPGDYITSAWKNSNTAINTISGTSMAAPHVAGAAALYLQGHPAATPAAVRNALVNASTKNKVIDPVGSPNRLLYSLIP